MADLQHIIPVLPDGLFMLEQFIANPLFCIRGNGPELRDPVDHVQHQVVTVRVVQHGHIKGSSVMVFYSDKNLSAEYNVTVLYSAISFA